MSTNFRLSQKFWGVRGSIPTPLKENMRYGGNTLCVEVRLPSGEVYVFDGGTGIRGLGDLLMEENDNKGFGPEGVSDTLPLGSHPRHPIFPTPVRP